MTNQVPITTNSVPGDASVVDRIAQRTLAKRGLDYAGEVRRLLDAGLDVMRRCGTTSRPRVSDIVAAAGLSNEAFYRHFPSKEALVAAILEDGTDRLRSYLAHRMDKESTPEAKIRRWVEGVLGQAADDDVAAATLAVLWNAGSIGDGLASGHSSMNPSLATLLRGPYEALGSADPDLDASLAAHATVGLLSDHLWRRVPPTTAEIDHIVGFCIAGVAPRPRPVARRERR